MCSEAAHSDPGTSPPTKRMRSSGGARAIAIGVASTGTAMNVVTESDVEVNVASESTASAAGVQVNAKDGTVVMGEQRALVHEEEEKEEEGEGDEEEEERTEQNIASGSGYASDSSSDSEGAARSVFMALQQLISRGATPISATAVLLSRVPHAAEPVLSAIANAPSLSNNLHALARLIPAVISAAAPSPFTRPRLNLHLFDMSAVARLVANASRIVVLSGAGVSVSCGVPDFRSKGGVYDKVLERFGLEDPQAIFDLDEFRMDPKLFYAFAKEVMPAAALRPSPTHFFIAELEKRGKLLRNYSQNIDGLERRAGVSEDRLVLAHGSFLSATCMRPSCRLRVPGDAIAKDVAAGEVPRCMKCNDSEQRASMSEDEDDDVDPGDEAGANGVLKPDIVFFGESLPPRVHECLQKDVSEADLVLVLGTSLQVAPVARIPALFPADVPRLLVNRELVGYRFDIELLGNCDAVIEKLRTELGWETEGDSVPKLHENVRFIPPRRFLFQGADDALARPYEDNNDELYVILRQVREYEADAQKDADGDQNKSSTPDSVGKERPDSDATRTGGTGDDGSRENIEQ